MSKFSFVNVGCFALITFCATVPTLAADPYKINVILPLTGNGSFLGKGQQQTLQALQAEVNKSGGIKRPEGRVRLPGRPVQPANGGATGQWHCVGQKPSVMIGSSLVAMCCAIAPLLKSGPFDYCLSPGVHPAIGSFQYSSSVDTRDLMDVMMRYFKMRGWTRIAFMSSTDASGQDWQRGLDEFLARPENAVMTVVERQSFNPNDISVSAQIERIKASKPQIFFALSSGAPIATVFKAAFQAGLNVPICTTNANQTFAQMDQYKDFLPKELYIASSVFIPHDGLLKLDPDVEAEQKEFYAVHKAINVAPDNMSALAWDPAKIVLSALRRLGPNATGEEVRSYVANLSGFAGVNGLYDFRATSQRGLNNMNAVMSRWDGTVHNWIAVSKPTGLPLEN
ncbi:ABC transporter substrate-binding protein [Roseiarcaceae bacterium H3SJ34-1]|uniref:ABC transporter substrate-binding protein n=1 Tax=Terripilifer ovatus TaxID=3032367 RepID=UPI003AB966F3|nr:ABC transporter substrate-binding protein [Roseiarcaceae bacterium H3SJ34-1]